MSEIQFQLEEVPEHPVDASIQNISIYPPEIPVTSIECIPLDVAVKLKIISVPGVLKPQEVIFQGVPVPDGDAETLVPQPISGVILAQGPVPPPPPPPLETKAIVVVPQEEACPQVGAQDVV